MKTTATIAILLLFVLAAPARDACCSQKTDAESPAVSTNSVYRMAGQWTDDSALSRTLAEFQGEPVVVSMIFTHCEYACPLLVNDMRRLRAALPESARARIRPVLVTFDTARDTPQVLHAFRAAQNLDSRWTLLRGADDDVQTLAMMLGVQYKQDARGQFAHSNIITVLNSEGEIVYQHTGLNGDLSPLIDAVLRVTR